MGAWKRTSLVLLFMAGRIVGGGSFRCRSVYEFGGALQILFILTLTAIDTSRTPYPRAISRHGVDFWCLWSLLRARFQST